MKQYYDAPVAESTRRQYVESGGANAFMRSVYAAMSIGLLITAGAAWYVAQNEALIRFFYSGFMHYVTMFAPLVIYLIFASRLRKMSLTAASVVFGIFATAMGVSLAYIFWIYSLGSIFQTFLITAGTFAAMALIGATTKVDLSKYRSFFMMALIGLII
ncbi:MAG: Bax inhibitor-1/YccA family protein, partial [Bacteroidota bacterium]